MIHEIQALYNDTITAEAAIRFGSTREQLTDLGGFESYVYEFSRDGQTFILKITHTMRRTPHYIQGELEWLNYLADHGVSVARAVPSVYGRMVETIAIPDGSAFLAICYEKAPGHHVTADEWNGGLFESLGRLMGRMHALTKDYALSDPAIKRQEWHEEEQLNVRKYVPQDQTLIFQKTDELMNRLHALPRDRDSYGLVHTDLNVRNFFVDGEGHVTAFDFDDIGYNWFVNDIAITLFYARWQTRNTHPETPAFTDYFLTHFMSGYLQENDLDLNWFRHIPDFLLLRYILLYTSFFQCYDVSTLTDEQWAYQEKHRAFIEDGLPVIDFDFAAFAERLGR